MEKLVIREINVVENDDAASYETLVNAKLKEGWELLHTHVVQGHEEFDYKCWYVAILARYEKEQVSRLNS